MLPKHIAQPDIREKRGATAFGFLSAKGGCGATTLACHVAAELGAPENRALLMDFDLHAGMIKFITKASTEYTLLDAVKILYRLDLDCWRMMVSEPFPGVDVLVSPPLTLVPAEEVAGDQIAQLLDFLRPHYEWIVVDLGQGLTPWALSVLEELDAACIVFTLEVPALTLARQLVQTLLDSGYGKNRIKPILNRSPKRLDVTLVELEQMLGLPIFHNVPNDYAVLYNAYSNGGMLTSASELGRGMARLAQKLVGVGT